MAKRLDHHKKSVALSAQQHSYPIRVWLDANKVWFETIAAVLLSAVSILVGILQLCAANRQNAITDKQSAYLLIQTEMAKAEQKRQQREEMQSKQAALSDLRDLCTAIYKEFNALPISTFKNGNPDYEDCAKALTDDQKVAWLDRMFPLWTKLGSNRILLDDQQLFEAYMHANGVVEIWGNVHNRPWQWWREVPPPGFKGRLAATFATVLTEMSSSLSKFDHIGMSPNIEPQRTWEESRK